MRKTVLYIIESLGLGGAEMLVVSQLSEVNKVYDIILVTLSPLNDFLTDQLVFDKLYCLQMRRKSQLFAASKKLSKIIEEHNVILVHSVLFWSVIVARLACGKKTPHVCSLATIMSLCSYKAKWYSRYAWLLDKITYKSTETIIGASREVLKDFDSSIGIKGPSKLLYNFVNDEFFYKAVEYKKPSSHLKLLAVGNLKKVKNYRYLIHAFTLLKDESVSIDIYGHGNLYASLKRQIDKYKLSINLKGLCKNIHEIMPGYDAFVMCSEFEGFGIAAAEAMAIGLPLLLSDIAVLKEISQGNAMYFNPSKPGDFVTIINNIKKGNVDLKNLSDKGKQIAQNNYTKRIYMDGLFEVFDKTLAHKKALKTTFA